MTATESQQVPTIEITQAEANNDSITKKELDRVIQKGETEDNNNDIQKIDTSSNHSKMTEQTPADDEDQHAPSLHSDKDADKDDDYSITDEQRQAMIELEKLKQQMEEDDDEYLGDEEPPEYDVTERLKQLNADLANDPTPVESQRGRRVGFKENLVEVGPPPPEESDDEDQTKDKNEKQNNTVDRLDLNGDSNQSQQQSQDNRAGGDNSENINTNNTSDKNEEKVLIERDGKFELVSTKELEAMGLQSQTDNNSPRASDNGSDTSSLNSTGSYEPRPPSKGRPNTANGSPVRRHRVSNGSSPRAQSASATEQRDMYSSDYRSPYGLTKEQLEIKKQRDRTKMERERAQQDRQREEEEQKQRENDDAFQAWLKKKKEDASRRRQGKNTKDQEEEEQRDAENSFNEWKQFKAKQQRERKMLEERRRKEEEEAMLVRPRDECDKAFKEWLKRKNQEARRAKQAQKQKARITVLAARRSRKSQALAKAIRQAQAFRYVDYYGYRY